MKVTLRGLTLFMLLGCIAIAQDSSRSSTATSERTTTQAKPKPTILVRPFTTASNMAWPYDMKQMQNYVVAELRSQIGNRFDVVTDLPAEHGYVLTLDGEITSWRPGNRAKRMLVGMGSGRESADIRYWLTDEASKKVVEHKDTIRAEFWGNAYAGSVGELAHPFGSKVAKRISDARLEY